MVASEALSATIRNYNARTFVSSRSMCASACFTVFASGSHKDHVAGARIGVHSAARAAYETNDSMAVTLAMARSASALGVPPAIVGRMVSTPPGAMAWLADAELASMGAERFRAIRVSPGRAARPGSGPGPSSPPPPQAGPAATLNPASAASALPARRPGTVAKDESPRHSSRAR